MIIRGPAIIKIGVQAIYTESDITLNPVRNTFDITTSAHGKVDERDDNFRWEVSFTPAGVATLVYFNALYPTAYRNPQLGVSIFGATDTDLTIHSIDGKQITLKRAALSKMPDLNFAANKQLFGECTFTALGTKEEAWSDVDHFAALKDAVFADTSFNPIDIKTLVYSVAFGDTEPWDDIKTEAGFTVSFDLQTSEVPSDAYGVADITIAGLSVSAKCTPHGIDASQLIAAMGIQGTGAHRGQSIYRNKKDLEFTAGSDNPFFTLKGAAIKTAPIQFGVEANRAGEVEFVAAQSISNIGARLPVFEIGVAE